MDTSASVISNISEPDNYSRFDVGGVQGILLTTKPPAFLSVDNLLKIYHQVLDIKSNCFYSALTRLPSQPKGILLFFQQTTV